MKIPRKRFVNLIADRFHEKLFVVVCRQESKSKAFSSELSQASSAFLRPRLFTFDRPIAISHVRRFREKERPTISGNEYIFLPIVARR